MQLAQNRAVFSSENLGTTMEAVTAVLEPDDMMNDRYVFIITDFRLHSAADAIFAELYRETAVFRGSDFISVILKDDTPELTNGYATHRTNGNDTERTHGSDTESIGVDVAGMDGEAAERTSAQVETAEPAGTHPSMPLYRFSIPHEIEKTIDRSNLRGVGLAIAQYIDELFDRGTQDRVVSMQQILQVGMQQW
ncbi:MAG: hypothetical protein Q9173_004191 [Seirophora scorigena]